MLVTSIRRLSVIIRKLRLQRGWTQDQLSELSGLSVRTIQRLERGETPTLETAKSLASVFGIDFQSLKPRELDMNTHDEKSTVSEDEKNALLYAKRVTDYLQGVVVTVIIAGILFYVVGATKELLLFFGVFGLALLIQGLIDFEVIRFKTVNFERYLAERKLGRKL